MNKNIALVVVGLPVPGPFDYAVDPAQREVLQEGMRVRVMFNRRRRVGYIVGFRETTDLKKVSTVIGPLENRRSLDARLLVWTRRTAEYYGCAWGELLELVYPSALRQGKYLKLIAPPERSGRPDHGEVRMVSGFLLREEDDPLWLAPVEAELGRGRAVLIVVPDKYYAAYFVGRLEAAKVGPVLSYEKRLKVADQLEQFQAVLGGGPTVIIGTRSSVFVPHPNIGRIFLVHEEHDWHKSEQSPHYRTARVALFRAEAEGSAVTFLGLNPRVELYHEAQRSGWALSAASPAPDCFVQLVDLTNYRPGKSSILSFPVQNTIRDTLAAQGRLLLFFNRKGFMTFTRCQQCGHAIKCPRCDQHLVLRHPHNKLSCHGCGFTRDVPTKCPECAWPYLRSSGMGIDKLESEVHRYFPQARTAVLDKDTQALPRRADIVLATSAIFKFQAEFRADQVIMMDYDQGLYHADFRSAHRSLTTLLLLRSLAREKLIIQTRMPDDPVIKAVRDNKIPEFVQSELATRRELNLPPHVCAATVVLRGTEEERVWDAAMSLHALIAGEQEADIEAGEPYPDIKPKLRDQYRYNIMLKSSRHEDIVQAVRRMFKGFRPSRQVIVTLDTEP